MNNGDNLRRGTTVIRKCASSFVAAVAVVSFFTLPAAAAQWTFMVYLDGDNDLEAYGIDDFMEMASVGSSEQVQIVVQFDRIPGYYSDRTGDWTTCKRFNVTKGMEPTAGNAVLDIGEVNMGNPATLTSFINWAAAAYPADRYALVLWDHGSGWLRRRALLGELGRALTAGERERIGGELEALEKEAVPFKSVCTDSTSGYDSLTMREVRAALDAAAVDVQLVGFDACLMAMLEVAYEIRAAGPQVMVGSEDTEPADGWPYERIIADLVANPSWMPPQLGANIVERYYERYGGGETQAAIDLAAAGPLAAAVDGLARVLVASGNGEGEEVRNSAAAVIRELDAAVIHERHGATRPNSHGLALYFPDYDDGLSDSYRGTVIDLPADTYWDEFLAAFRESLYSTWVGTARRMAQEFEFRTNVDLYGFCEQLADPPVPCDRAYSVQEGAAGFEDIGATGTPLPSSDDGSVVFPLPFAFPYYCAEYTQVRIASNGFLHFSEQPATVNTAENVCIPGANDDGIAALIAPFWDDLNPASGGEVLAEVRGEEPRRRLIVQWQDVPHYYTPSPGQTVTFQAVLFEGSGEIFFAYRDAVFGNGSYDLGASAVVGLQENQINGLSWSCRQPTLRDGMTLLFTPSLAPQSPGGLAASDGVYADRVRVTWRNVAAEDGYRIYRSAADGPYGQVGIAGRDVLFFEDPLPCGSVPYAYRVAAFNSFGESSPSASDTGYAGACELLGNGSFEEGEGDIPAPWVGRETDAGDRRVEVAARSGIYSVRMGGTLALKRLRQQINISGGPGERISLGAWSRARYALGAGFYGVQGEIFYASGATRKFSLFFSRGSHDWEYREKTVVAAEAYTKIVVRVYYAMPGGRAWFDDVSLARRFPVQAREPLLVGEGGLRESALPPHEP